MSNFEEEWKPNEEYLQAITSMGISHNIATEALFCTGNKSIDEAVNYVFSSQESGESTGSPQKKPKQVRPGNHSDEETDEGEEDVANYYKMTFVVNTSLKMGIGKIAAQVGHACLGLYRDMQRANLMDILNEWEYIGEKKIVLKGIDDVHLKELYEKAKAASIPCYLVKDAGHTQIAPGSVTVLSLFGLEEEIDKITGKLSLL